MKGERMTKAQLIDELAVAHRRIAELERSAAEEKEKKLLRNSNLLSSHVHLLQQLLNGIPIPVFYKDKEGRYLGCNTRQEKFIGLTRNQLIGKTVFNIAPKDLAEIYHAADADLFNHPGDQVYEASVLHADGSRHDVIFNKTTFKDVNGNVAGIIGAIQDITERKRAEEALKESEERFKAQYHGSPIPTFTWQKTGDVFVLMGYNNAAEVMTHGDAAQYIGKAAHEMYEFQQDVLEDLRKCFEERITIKKELISKHFLPGKFITSTYVFVPNALVMVHIEDITERKQAEEALQQSEDKYRTLTEKMNDIVWTTDLDFNVIYMSPSVTKLVGFTPEECMQIPPWEAITPESLTRATDILNEELLRDQEEGIDPERIVKFEMEDYHKNGSTVWVECVVSAIRDNTCKIIGLHGVSRDISERKRAEMDLKRYRENLEEMVNTRTAELTKTYAQLKQENDVRRTTEVELDRRRLELEEMNTALRVILKQREEDKTTIEMNVISNHKVSILPYIGLLERTNLDDEQKTFLSIIKSNLNVITSTFSRKISSGNLGLTTNELKVASLIKEGKTSKEIAGLLNVSITTINAYRRKIRAKTDLRNKDINLRSYLQSLE
jgi:PAS domain S-box-containing protein